MSEFGKTPPRSLRSFGVAGLLEEGCHVLYCSLFDTSQIGKISDLICARLREGGVDELPVRMALALEVFEAAALAEGGFAEPVTLECGIDSEKIAVGISFRVPEAMDFDFARLGERLRAGKAEGRFEEIAVRLGLASDRLICRYDSKARRFEAVALVGIPGKIAEEQRRERAEARFVLVGEGGEPAEQTPQAGSYTELGDLDYAKLLADRVAVAAGKAAAVPLGEKIASASEAVEQHQQTVKGAPAPEEDQFEKKFTSDGKIQEDQTELRIKAGGPGASPAGEESEIRFNADRSAEVEALKKRIAELESRTLASGPVGESKDEEKIVIGKSTNRKDDEESEKVEEGASGGSFFGRLKRKLFSSKKKSEDVEEKVVVKAKDEPSLAVDEEKIVIPATETVQEETKIEVLGKVLTTDEAETVQVVSETSGADGGEDSAAEEQAETKIEGQAEPETSEEVTVVSGAVAEASGNLDRVLEKAKREAEELNLGSNEKAKRWMDGLMAQMVSEKAKIQEMTKSMELTLRKKELEFKNKERTLQDELRKKDEVLKQRQTALSRAKEQLSQVQATLEKEKELRAASNEEGFKQKYATAQKLLASAKTETQDLTRKLEEARQQMAVLKTRPSGPSAELTAIKLKFERTQKQVDELKRTNQQLMDRLSEAGKKDRAAGGGANPEEMRRRLDNATKMANQFQKDAGDLQRKLDEAKAEQLRLKRDLELANRSLKEAQKAASKKADAA